MTVFRNLDIAKIEMANLANKLHEVIYLTYTLYGNNPHKIEFNLCIQSELVGGRATNRLMYQYSPIYGIVEFQTIEDIEEELGEDVFFSIKTPHHCGDMAMKGSSSCVDELYFGQNI